jgi:alpha-tubulin suppressor-like RCC1 family protein
MHRTARRLIAAPRAAVLAAGVLTCSSDGTGPSGPASQLAFQVQPSSTASGKALSSLKVAVHDQSGRVVPSASVSVTLALAANPAGASLTGALLQPAVNGVATFAGLKVNRVGAGYTLMATATGLGAATSASFEVTGFLAVGAGASLSCGLMTGGAAYCWGSNRGSGLGNGSAAGPETCNSSWPCSTHPVPVSGGHHFSRISVNGAHACGLAAGGLAYCWGTGDYGALGNGSDGTSTVPVAVSGGLSFGSISAGVTHTCGVTTTGVGYCWGPNDYGELGSGNTSNSNVPVAVAGGLTFASITAGGLRTCGLTTTGAAYCWGLAQDGLGNDPGTVLAQCDGIVCSPTPLPATGGLTFTSLTAGQGHFCGLSTGGAAWCWGLGQNGQLGNDTTLSSLTPTPVTGGLSFTSLAAAYYHTCGVTSAGTAYCWGDNWAGQLGDRSTTDRHTPALVFGGTAFTDLRPGVSHTCGLSVTGEAYCWGENYYGEVGDGSTTLRNWPSPVPTP